MLESGKRWFDVFEPFEKGPESLVCFGLVWIVLIVILIFVSFYQEIV